MEPNITINIEKLIENFIVEDATNFSENIQDEVTDKLLKVIKSAQSQTEPHKPLEYQKDLHNPAKLPQNKEKFQDLLPEMILCSEVYQNFCCLLNGLSHLDRVKQLYGMLLHRTQIMEQEYGQNQPKFSQVAKTGWRRNFEH